MKFYRHNETKQILIVTDENGVKIEGLTELKANTTDAAAEKHVPVVSIDGNTVTVTVGSVPHPMTEEHQISWILLKTDKGHQIKEFAHTDAPTAVFELSDGEKAEEAYEYCNLHGLWKAEV